METYNNKLKTLIPRPVLDVKVSNPFALVGEQVTVSTLTKWVTAHRYQLDAGNGATIDVTVPCVIGESEQTISIGEETTLEQKVSVENSSGSKLSLKRIYAMSPQELPYFDITVSKEIVRTDNEITQVRISPELGYAGEHIVIVRIYQENTEDQISSFTNSLQGDGYKYIEWFSDVRGIYDVEVDVIDTASGKMNTKRINKLITVTPKLAVRANAHEYIVPNAKKATSPDAYTLNGDNYPAGSTIVLKADPNEPVGYPMRLKFLNFKGTWDNPYIITIDQSEQFVINWYYYWGINVGGASEHIVFDGRGYQNIENGLKLQPLPDEEAVAAFSAGELSHEIEVFHIEIQGTNFAGFFIKTDPDINRPETWYGNFRFNRLLLHHNYIHDTDSEGCYLGHYSMSLKKGDNKQGQYVEYRAHHLYDCRVYRNEYVNNGYDALQFNNAENLEICYNSFRNSGHRNEPDQTSVMSLGLSGKIYNNVCLDYSGPCIQFSTLGKLEIFNNIFANGTETGSGLYLLASEDTPEQNPNDQGYNELPVLIYNNIIMSKAGGGLGARNTTQYRNVKLIDNFVVTTKGVLCGGQSAETVALWNAAAKGNVLITQKVNDYPALDDAYLFGDSAGGDYRIAANSPLIKDGTGMYFKHDFRGYKNWFGSVYPVGAFMGIYQLAGLDETFRILTLTLDDGAIQTVSGLVAIQWTHYGSLPITDYQVSESAEFAEAEWVNYTVDAPVTYQFTGSKGHRTLYVRLRNSSNEVTEGKSVSTTWVYRTAKLAIMASDTPSGKFNSDTGIHYHRLDSGKNVTFKDTLGNNMGVVNSDKVSNVYGGSGITTGNESGIYPDKVLEKTGSVRLDTSAKIIDEPLIITLGNLTAGTYKVSVFVNSNKGLNEIRKADLDAITPYFKFEANGVDATAISLYKNFETLVEVGNVTVTDGGQITLTAYWHNDVMGVTKAMGYVYGAINLIEIEEV